MSATKFDNTTHKHGTLGTSTSVSSRGPQTADSDIDPKQDLVDDVRAILKSVQESYNWSRAQLACSIGVSLVTIDRWKRGVGQPSLHQLARIEELLQTSTRIKPGPSASFPSTGARRYALKSSQLDLFIDSTDVRRLPSPGLPIIHRLKRDRIFGDRASICDLLSRNAKASSTRSDPIRTGASAGKNTYTYDAHTYHTKVPPQGISEYIRHYLPAGGLVLDPFAGSGMTGVAARVTGHDVILNELSPAACFIAHNFTETVDPASFAAALRSIMRSLSDLRMRLYATQCRECGRSIEVAYYVWSYRVECYHCRTEFLLWDHSRKYGNTVREHKILRVFDCPHCGCSIQKRRLVRTDAEPVLLGYRCCSRTLTEHKPSSLDLDRISHIDETRPLAHEFVPTNDLPDGVNLRQPMKHGISSIDKFYSTRNLSALSHIWREIHCLADTAIASAMAFVFTSLYQRVSRLSEYRFWGGSGNTARFNVPYIFNEANVFVTFERKADTILDHLQTTAKEYKSQKAIICGTATAIPELPSSSIDFIFTDPPFGANINYSEMNILWESWLGEFTDPTFEAVINRYQNKGVAEYGSLMLRSLQECYRVLRPGHWMLLVFMNNSASVWNELKRAIVDAGFCLERADIFDKQHGTFKQFVSPNTAGQDLVIHCRKGSTSDRSPTDVRIPFSDSIRDFVCHYQRPTPTSTFLHVHRPSEIDFRVLYSEWLSRVLVRDHEICDFSVFREIAKGIVNE